MQIHELPAQTNAADTDVVAIDTGTSTQKITIANLGKHIAESSTPAYTSGDAASPSSWANVATITSGLALSTLFNRLSTMVKNVRYLYTQLMSVQDKITGLTSQTENFADKTAQTSATILLGSFTLPAGKWLILGVALFGASANGYRAIGIATNTSTLNKDRYSLTRTGVAGSATMSLQVVNIVSNSVPTTYYLNAYQTSGGNLTVSSGYYAVKLM